IAGATLVEGTAQPSGKSRSLDPPVAAGSLGTTAINETTATERLRPQNGISSSVISAPEGACECSGSGGRWSMPLDLPSRPPPSLDRKSTRLNSSHLGISYAVF